jgi:hypothetical protein
MRRTGGSGRRRARDREPRVALTITQFLESVPIGRTLLYEEIAAGHLTPIKVGARTLIAVAERDRYLRDRQRGPRDAGARP